MRSDVADFLNASADGYGAPDFAAATEALVVAGLLAADDAARWNAEHQRLTTVPSAEDDDVDPAVERAAIELLEDLVRPVRPRDSEEWDLALYQRFQDALMTLAFIGALTVDARRPWLARQQKLLNPPGGYEPTPAEMPMPYAARELIDVLPGPDIRHEGMRITSLELYDDCVVVRAHLVLPPEPADPVEHRTFLRLRIDDDRGTDYWPARTPSAPGDCASAEVPWGSAITPRITFTPGPPLDAKVFTVTWRDHEFPVS